MLGFENIENILTDILGETKSGFSDNGQGQFNCPCCTEANGGIPDGKFNLEVNIFSMQYNCWKCGDTDGTKGRLIRLIKKYGSPTQYLAFKTELDYLIKSKLYDINAYSGVTFQNEEQNIVRLPKTFTKINLSKCYDKKLLEYLNKRKIDQYIIDKFNLGYTTWDEKDYTLRKRLIIPSYDEYGDLNFWTGRDYTDFQQKMKYKNCDANRKNILFHESLIDFDSDIVLCEGAIDCLYYPNSISLLSKHLGKDDYTYQTIRNKANANVIICLDADTDINETKRIYSSLNFGRLRNKIKYIRLEKYKDFGEVYENEGKKGMINAIRSAKQFDEIDLVI